MAAVGVPSGKVEIEWTPGTWTDVTGYVAYDQGMTGTFGRTSEFDDVSAGTWSLLLHNDDGRFTPDNPVSPYFPGVVENVRLRVTVTPPGGAPYVRFVGYVTALAPTFPNGEPNQALVQVDAADLLAVMGRRNMMTGWVEQENYVARYNGTWCDTFTFAGTADSPTVFENVGERGGRTATGTASIVLANVPGTSDWDVGTATGLAADVALSLTPAGIVGPVLKVVPGGVAQILEFFLKIPPTGLAVGATGLTIVDAYRADGLEVFSLRVVAVNHGAANTVDLAIYNGQGVLDSAVGSAIIGSTAVDNDTWFKITLVMSGGNLNVTVNDGPLYAPFGYGLDQVTAFYFGGFLSNNAVTRAAPGKQTYCLKMSIAGVAIQGASHGAYSFFALGTPPATTSFERFKELAGYGSALYPWRTASDVSITSGSAVITSATGAFSDDDIGRGIYVTNGSGVSSYFRFDAVVVSVQGPGQATLSATASATASGVVMVVGPAVIGTDTRALVRYNTAGQTLAEALQLHARTIGGAVWVSNGGVLTLIQPDGMRSTTLVATVDADADIDGAQLDLRRSVDQTPTRVTVNCPVGQAVVVNTAAEAQGYRRDVTVEAASGSYADAYALGSYYLAATSRLRISRVVVDFATASNNLYAAFLGGLRPGARVRVANLPANTFGLTYMDAYVQGWTEHYAADGATITLDCSPADAPTEAVFDDAEYGRFAADRTLNLAWPITAGATALSVAPSQYVLAGNPVMTTSSADYPLDLELTGDRLTLPAVPGTATRTNLCTNPSLASTAGWSGAVTGFTASTISAVATPAYIGSTSLKAVWPTVGAAGSAVGYTLATTAGQVYSFAVWVFVPTGCPAVQIAVLAGGATGVSYSRQASTGATNAWVRLGVSFTASSTSTTLGISTVTASTAGQAAYLDNALVEQTTNGVGSYLDGRYGGTWTGTADASTSTQTVQTYTGVTRGVAPSVARAHLAGEDVECWHAGTFAL